MISALLTSNFTKGRAGQEPCAIVVHVTAGSTAEGTLSWFKNSASEVSAHYLVDKDGSRVWNLVLETDTAWHAGVLRSRREELNRSHPELNWVTPSVSTNVVTIGIEHVGLEHDIWPPAQYAASASLIAGIARRWSIPLDAAHVVGHRLVYPGHPGCPGTCDLDRLIAMAQQIQGAPLS